MSLVAFNIIAKCKTNKHSVSYSKKGEENRLSFAKIDRRASERASERTSDKLLARRRGTETETERGTLVDQSKKVILLAPLSPGSSPSCYCI